MPQPHSSRSPRFFWQGALIVLPVLLLAAVGTVSLRLDKILAQHEAADRAQAIAEELAPKMWAALAQAGDTNRVPPGSFEVSAAGDLIFPRPYPVPPVPREFDISELSPEQTRLWQEARRAEATVEGPSAALAQYRHFLDSNPPEPFRGAARYALGVALGHQRHVEDAVATFDLLLKDSPQVVGESGLPLGLLAELKLNELSAAVPGESKNLAALDTLCSNAVYQPTILTGRLLDLAGERGNTPDARQIVSRWRAVWLEHELSRRLFGSVRSRLGLGEARFNPPELASAGAMPRNRGATSATRLFWFTSPVKWTRSIKTNTGADDKTRPGGVEIQGNDWLGIEVGDPSTNHWFRCLGESEAGARVSAPVDSTTRIPDYFGVGIVLAGRTLTFSVPNLRVWEQVNYFGRRGGGEKRQLTDQAASIVLGTASHLEDGAEAVKVNVYLTSPATLFQRQRARTFWFGSLIAAAAAAALAGFLAAYRAFVRQLRLSAMKSNFVSSVSHELRAPIASVRLMAESLARGKVPEPSRQHEYFRFIVQECRRLSSLIENVLDFSRIEQGRKEYDMEPTDLAALSRQTVKLMEPCAAERHIGLTLDLDRFEAATPQPQISVDGKAIQQALVNLIDNAIKHSPKGQTVSIGMAWRNAPGTAADYPRSAGETLAPYDGGGARVRPDGAFEPVSPVLALWVEDHGEGIPPADHERIFERFYRRGSELRRETSGVGIGLSIVKHIVEAHGGRVRVRSGIGQGSRFTIELPVAGGGDKPEEG